MLHKRPVQYVSIFLLFLIVVVLYSIYMFSLFKKSPPATSMPSSDPHIASPQLPKVDSGIVEEIENNDILALSKEYTPIASQILVKRDESVIIDTLTIKNVSGGYKILMDKSNLSYARLQYIVNGEVVNEQDCYATKNPIIIGEYAIILSEVTWRGDIATLTVYKK